MKFVEDFNFNPGKALKVFDVFTPLLRNKAFRKKLIMFSKGGVTGAGVGVGAGAILDNNEKTVYQKTGMLKNAKIIKEDGKFVLYTSDGKRVLGRHDSREKALRQERAIWASKRASVNKIEKVFYKLAQEFLDEKEFNIAVGTGVGAGAGNIALQAKNLYRQAPNSSSNKTKASQKALLDILEGARKNLPTRLNFSRAGKAGLAGLVIGGLAAPFLSSNK